jgi:hypothetical protein
MRWISFIGLSFVLVCSAGCSTGTKLVPVSGKVMIDGEVLKHGVVQVAPAGSRPSFADIGPDGTFTFTTYKNNDGIAPGTHPVAVIAHETLGPGSQRWHAPKKYMSTSTSGLTVTIDKPRQDLVIELTWKDSGHDGPFVEHQEKE